MNMNKIIQWVKFDVKKNDDDFEEQDELGIPTIQHTPFGLCKIDGSDPLTQSKMWIAHTNFRLKPKDLRLMTNIDGIEAVHPISRYRLAVVIGELFDDQDVQTEFDKMFCLQDPTNLKVKLKNLQTKLSEFDYWGIYVFPNGDLDHFKAHDQAEFNTKLQEYKEASDLSDGYILTHESKEHI